MRMSALALVALLSIPALPVAAQDEQTLADIRQELTILHVEVQRLNRELSTTGTPTVNLSGTSVLERVAAIEAELQRLTAQSERLNNRVERIVADGTNRIGDLEFRLVELEGGDVSQLGETSTLGGAAPGEATPAIPAEPGKGVLETELAVGEKSDFDRASAVLEEGAYAKAAELFATFNQSYPGSPLAAQADLSRGKALDGVGDTREAARAYLASFTGNSTGPVAPNALFELGSALGRLGQSQQACITLGEVIARFPQAQAVPQARTEMTKLGCL